MSTINCKGCRKETDLNEAYARKNGGFICSECQFEKTKLSWIYNTVLIVGAFIIIIFLD